MKRKVKLTAIALTICLLSQIFSIYATAETHELNITDTQTAKKKPKIVAEIEQNRDENEKHFLLSDGRKMAVSYPTAVHYKDKEGEWQDIDNTLKSANDDEYTTTDSNIEVTLFKKMKKHKTVELNIDGYRISWGFADANNSDAQVQSSPERKGNNKFLILDDITSTTVYEDIFENVDAEYIINPQGVKENIILNNDEAQKEFEVVYKYKDLTPKQKDDKTILLKNAKNKTIYTIEAPVMFDSNGQTSEGVSLEITKSNSSQMTVKLTADEEWLEDKSREYPVVIDPEVSSATVSTIYIAGASSSGTTNVTESTSMMVGTHNYAGFPIDNMGVIRITDLPSIGTGGYVTDAKLTLAVNQFSGPVGIYSFDSAPADLTTLNWSNLTTATSGYADDITTRTTPENFFSLAEWDITASAQINYRKEPTFILKSESGGLSQFMAFTPFTLPYVEVTYVDKTGISDKNSYHTQSMGRAGTAYINDLTGRLEVSRTDMGYESEKMSASIGMNFISSGADFLYHGLSTASDTFDYGWRNSYFENITTPENNAYYKVWFRGDGTRVYFTSQSTTVDEDTVSFSAMHGYDYKFIVNTASGVDDYIEATDGTRYYFDTYGRLIKIQNGEDTTDKITISYQTLSSNNYQSISQITDGDGKVYRFTYDSNANLISVVYMSANSTVLDAVTYSYNSNNKLIEVNYHGEKSRYAYTETGLIKSITAPDGYKIAYEYYDDTAGASYNPRVKKVTEYGSDNTKGNHMTVTYDNNRVVYEDANGKQEIIIFNKHGNIIATMDENGFAINEITDKDGNFLGSTSVTVPTENILRNHSFENALSGWTSSSDGQNSYTSDTTRFLYGFKSVKLQKIGTGYVKISQEYDSLESGDYTLSAYAFAENITGDKGATVCAEVQLANGNWKTYYGDSITSTSSEWSRPSVSFTVPQGALNVKIHLGLFDSAGTVYFDGVQLEKHKRAYDYNMIENSDFTYGATSWSLYNGASIETNTEVHGGYDQNVVKLTEGEYTTQAVYINGSADDSYTISGWIKTENILPYSYNAALREMQMLVIGIKADGETASLLNTYSFDPYIQNNWYKFADRVTLNDSYARLAIQFQFFGPQGVIYLDGIELFSDAYFEEYDSTTDSETEDTTTDEGETTTDDEGRITSQTEDGVTTSYEYEGKTDYVTKETISAQINGATHSIITKNNRTTSNGIKTETVTDELGNTVKTLTDVNFGNIIGVVDGNNNQTDYEYNALQQLTELSALRNSSATASNIFTYEHDKTKTITHNGFNYTFNYNNFGDIVSIYVGSQPLVTYSYQSNINRVTSSVTFGNGSVINYAYDDNFNVTQVKYGDTLAITYDYDEMGGVLKTTDHKRGTVTKQIGEETQVWNLDETTLWHSYKNDGDNFVEKIGSQTYTTAFSYNEETDVSTVTYDGKTQTTTTDKFGRITKIETKLGNTVLSTQNYYYKTWTDSDGVLRTSQQISEIVTVIGNKTISEKYTYDANGNITEIKKNNVLVRSYQYDKLNQLYCEFNYEDLKYYQYNYDSAGNFVAVVTLNMSYSPETGIINGMTYVGQQDYTYGDSNWKDKLTAVGGQAITYDAIGNPISYKGYALTWEQGRQLKGMVKDGVYTDYTYDENGIRTSKSSSNKQTWSDTYKYKTVDGRITYEEVTLTRTNRHYNNYFYYDDEDSIIGFNHKYFDYGNTYQWLTAKYTYIKNLQGDIVGIVDESGALVAEYEYDAWGKITAIEDGNGNDVSSNADHIANKNPMRYRGYYYDRDTGWYYLQSRYYDPGLRRFLNQDDVAFLGATGTVLGYNLFAYCENNPINMVDLTGNIAANVIGAIIGGVIGAVGGAFLGKWLADRLGITGFWARAAFIGAVGLLVGAAAAAIGYFIGPYVAKAWSVWSAKLSGLIKGTFKSIAKITSKKMSHINVSKHLWNKVMKKVTKTQIETLIYQGIRKGTWNLLTNGSVKILYKYGGQIIVITGKVVNNIFQIGDAWVWNGIGTP